MDSAEDKRQGDCRTHASLPSAWNRGSVLVLAGRLRALLSMDGDEGARRGWGRGKQARQSIA